MQILLAALLYAIACLCAAVPIALSTSGRLIRSMAALLFVLLLPSIHRRLDSSELLDNVTLWRTCLKIYSWIQTLHTINNLVLTPASTANPRSFVSGLWDAIKCNWRWREIGTRREARNTPPFPSTMEVSRYSVCKMHAIHASWCFLALDIIAFAPQPDAQQAMSRERQLIFGRDNVTAGELGFRGGAVAAFWIANFLGLSANYSCLAILSMVVFRADPNVWRPCFGRPRDAYTVRRFWGIAWHQLLRNPLTKPGRRLTRILGLPVSGPIARYLTLYIAFLASGYIHYNGDCALGVPKGESGALWFFQVNALAIMTEDGVLELCRQAGIGKWSGARYLGFVWVALFFYITTPPWAYPEARVGGQMRLLPFGLLEIVVNMVPA